MKQLKLKAAEAVQEDMNKGIVRIDSEFMKKAGIKSGDVVAVKGERKTAAIIYSAYPGDIGLNIVRMDGMTRSNAKTGIGEIVKLKKADFKEAKKVVIVPAREGIHVSAPQDLLKKGLLEKSLVKGDIVTLTDTKEAAKKKSCFEVKS